LYYKNLHKLKVVHITTSDTGGAGIAARNIHHALRALGLDSWMLVRWRRTLDNAIVQVQPNLQLYTPSSNGLLRKMEEVLRRRGKLLTTVEQYEREMDRLDMLYGAAYTMPVSQYDLTQHPLVKKADVIHLHWIENFVDYPTFFQKIDKPIVWTFHDENIAYGGFHYTDEANRFKEPFAEIENQFVRIKKNALRANLNIHMVALSKQMEKFYHEHGLQPNYPVSIIHNGILPNDFQNFDREYCRKILGIPVDRIVLSFCASDINDKYKGLDTLVQALEQLNNPNITLLCVGKGELPKSAVNIVGTGTISNPRLMSVAYSASDLFVLPSFQESFGQAPVEAMACGCPVVAFPCGIIDELITPESGVRCPDFGVESLVEGIQTALDTKYDREEIRMDVVERFNIIRIAEQYIELYKALT
jgi:glycosyltransferase involved in cell wall biosynthesis